MNNPVFVDDDAPRTSSSPIDEALVSSQQVPSNLTKGSASGTCSAIIYGNWADLVVAQWGSPLDILVNPYGSSYAAGNAEIRAMSSLDIGVRHNESFAAMTDALTA